MKYLNHIDYIYTVYKEKSFSKAAKKLYISQPSLSLTIKKIEQDLGFEIFVRSAKTISLTPLGQKYIAAIEDILQICNDLEKETDDVLNLRKGSVTIGTTTFVAAYILPQIIKKFRANYPDIRFRIVVEHSCELEKMLEENELDLVIDNTISFRNQYEYFPLFEERIFIGIHNELDINNVLDKNKPVDLADLANENFILLKKGNKMRQIAEQMFQENTISPIISMEFDQLQTAISYANNGFGICFVGDIALENKSICDKLNLYVPSSEFASRTLYMIKKKNRYNSNACVALEHFIKDAFGE